MLGLAAILLSLLLMILLIRRGWKLSLSIWIALPIMALISGLSWAETGEALRVAALSSVTHNLLLSILGIGLLGEMLYYNGSIERALQAIKKMIGDPRYIITALPAFIGLMPIPGGAYLSAPLVNEVGKEIEISKENLALANVFYRHVFYFFFPLYPALIAFLEMSTVPLYYIILFSVFPFLVAFLQSFNTIFRSLSVENYKFKKRSSEGRGVQIKTFLYSIFPILVALFFPLVLEWPYYTGLALAVLVSLVQWMEKNIGSTLWDRVKKLQGGVKVDILITIAGIMIFKELVLVSQALDPLAELLSVYGFPVVIIALIIPYLSGLATGNQIAALGISLPLLIPLIPAGMAGWPYLSLAYLASLMGYLVSPVHLCPVLTVEYFAVPLHKVIYRLQIMSLGVLAASLILAWILITL